MLFNNKVTADKASQGAFNYLRNMMEETDANINKSVNESAPINVALGRAGMRRILHRKKFNLQEDITHKLFKENIYDLYKKSLLLDEDFKDAQDANLYKLFEETFDNMMNENFFSWDSIRNNSSKFISNLYMLCEETAKESADKAVNMDTAKNMKASKEALISEKDEEDEEGKKDSKKKKDKEVEEAVEEADKKEIDEKTKEDKEAVSDAIKEKVVSTIKDEKERSEKEEADKEEVKELSKTDKERDEEASGEGTEEEPAATEDNESSSDEGKEDKTTWVNKDEKKDDSKKEKKDDEKKSEDYNFFTRVMLHPNKFKNTSLFRSIQMNVSNKFMKEKQAGMISEDVQMNMDLIFAESLAYYTLLETFNTINLTNLKPSEAKEICKRLILE